MTRKNQAPSAPSTTPRVYLVGAGPGDPGMVTLRARELIESCDVLVYDRLVNPRLRDWVKPGCELIYVGKDPHFHAIPQDKIEDIIVERARAGKQVVRLKGGDAFVFGRGGEEACRLQADGIAFEIVPGVTAALAAAACSGIPLTHRDHSSSLVLLTGHESQDKGGLRNDFSRFATAGDTLCIYMGMGHLAAITDELMAAGRFPDTPVAVIQWASTPRQRSLLSTLRDVAPACAEEGLGSPAIVVVGDVARYCREINWFEQRPLFGRRIVITRTRAQGGQLRQRLEQLGADVLEIPLIGVNPDHQPDRVSEVMGTLGTYAWLVFTSANGVRHFFDLFFQRYRDLRCLGGARIACVGPGTAEALAALHLEVDVIPEQAVAEALAEAIMAHETIENSTLLVVIGNRNRPALVEKLEQEGRAIVDTLQVYATHAAVPEDSPDVQRFRAEGADAVVFTSSSTVEAFAAQAAALQLAPDARRPKVCSMGPITSGTLRKKGLPVDVEAADSTLDGLVTVLLERLSTTAKA